LISNCSISHSVKKLFPELVEKGGDRTLKIWFPFLPTMWPPPVFTSNAFGRDGIHGGEFWCFSEVIVFDWTECENFGWWWKIDSPNIEKQFCCCEQYLPRSWVDHLKLHCIRFISRNEHQRQKHILSLLHELFQTDNGCDTTQKAFKSFIAFQLSLVLADVYSNP
jgi:hypothetical protein